MKLTKPFKKRSLMSVMGLAMIFTAVSCNKQGETSSTEQTSQQESTKAEEPATVNEVAGVYTQYLSTDEIWDYLRSFQASTSSKEAQSVYELNTLVLTKGGGEMLRPTEEKRYPQVQDTVADPVTWDAAQRRYELTKEFRMIDVGVHLTVHYYGTYTFSNRNVTLTYPEYASANYFYGTGWNGCEDYSCYMFRPGDVLHNGASAHTFDPFAPWYGSYIEPVRSDIAPTASVPKSSPIATNIP